jgi:hypothetical protein
VLIFLARAIRQEKKINRIKLGKINRIKLGKEKVKSLLADDMILYVKDPKESTRKVLDLINTFSKVAGYKIKVQNIVFFYTTTNLLKKKSGKQQ